MAKVIGKLISATSEDFRGDRFARVGTMVEIELPKGMRAIGKCRTCKHARHTEPPFIYCIKLDMTQTVPDRFGCWEWRCV